MLKKDFIYIGTVTRVVDGDTIDAELDLGFHVKVNLRFRILDLDTPEMRSRSLDERKHAHEATDYAEKILLGKVVKIKSHKTGKYGRWLADISLELEGFVVDFSSNMKLHGFQKREDYGS